MPAPWGYAYCIRVDQRKNIVWAAGGETCSFVPLVARSADKGESWDSFVLPFIGSSNICYSLAFHPDFPDIIYAGLERAVVQSIDGGKSWKFSGLTNVPVRFQSIAVDLLNRDHIYAGGSILLGHKSFPLWESFDRGSNWRPVEAAPDIHSLASDPNNSGVMYLASSDGVWRYESKPPSLVTYFPLQIGNWWTFSRSLTESVVDTIRIKDTLFYKFDQYRHFPNALLRMTGDNKLLLRDNTQEQLWLDFSAAIGDSWKITTPLAEWAVHLESKSDTVIVPAGTFTNCYRFWFQFNGADNDWVEWYAPGVGPVKRILYGIAMIEYPLTSAYVNGLHLPTEIEKTPESNLPEQFYLYPNYPNPFNAMTTISFDLPFSSDVTLEIYNIMGKKVRTLLADQKPAGHFEVQWDGTDESKQSVASGIYFCRLSATKSSRQPVTLVNKLLLLR
ncbi:MAG: T9SS type A sorting domain-containing protein [candidate division KSB1 bacterium]|nr:T9SS type A sorting domain-containing protein [candidate division KSB1 bacterium]